MKNVIDVLIIEDSALMRRELAKILESDPAIRVIGSAMDGNQGLEKIQSLNPDVVTLDINLPGMDGLTCLQYIMLTSPRPCVIISAYTGVDSVETFEALELGAIDFVKKPSGEISRDIKAIAPAICAKIKAASMANLGVIQPQAAGDVISRTGITAHPDAIPDAAVVIGVSTGGPRTLMQIIPSLPARMGVPVIIVQHMPPKYTESFANRLDQHCRMPVKEARDNEPMVNNTVYVAPGGFNLTFTRELRGIYTRVTLPTRNQIIAPSVDVTLNSVIDLFGNRVVGVILTGMGNDGLAGIRRLYESGGKTLAESRETAVIYGMPREVIDNNVISQIVPSHAMAAAIGASVKKISRGRA